jgi:hypothetical protein
MATPSIRPPIFSRPRREQQRFRAYQPPHFAAGRVIKEVLAKGGWDAARALILERPTAVNVLESFVDHDIFHFG